MKKIFTELLLFRFSNIFKIKNARFNNILNVVKKVKSENSLDTSCDASKITMLTDESIVSHVKAVEQKLEIESSEQIDETMTNDNLKAAAEMFIYLISCPYSSWFKSWSSFYKDLFLSKPPDQIILTLNRMMKSETPQENNDKLRSEKLLQRITSQLSLKFDEIRSLLQHTKFGNISFEHLMILNGAIHVIFTMIL